MPNKSPIQVFMREVVSDMQAVGVDLDDAEQVDNFLRDHYWKPSVLTLKSEGLPPENEGRIYRKFPDGAYSINTSVFFIERDLRSNDWPKRREDLIQSNAKILMMGLKQAEEDLIENVTKQKAETLTTNKPNNAKE